MKATLISIGDELLNGQTVDTNSSWIGQRLTEIGVDVRLKLTVSDELNQIVHAIKVGVEKSDLIITTGGLGPTKDDVSKNAFVEYLDDELVFHQPSFARISAYFKKIGRPTTDAHRQQCYMPSQAELIHNPKGTAPGMWMKKNNTFILSMPGVPYEMKAIMEETAIAKIKALNTKSAISQFIIKTVGLGETILAEEIEPIVDSFPDGVTIAYLPSVGGVKLRITAKGTNQEETNKLSQKFGKSIQNKLQQYCFGLGQVTLEEAVGNLLLENNLQLGTAESCTGGKLAAKIVSISGSSRYFQGSIVSYSNEIKMNSLGVKSSTLDKHGAVSEATVEEMLDGLLKVLPIDIGVAISGIAGPGGGTIEKPVGTIHIIAGNKKNTMHRLLKLSRSRDINIEYTTIAALDLVRKFIQKNYA